MKKEIRQRIMETAITIFARKGFFQTTVDDIARSSKVAKGTIYLYFRDKSDIYISIIEEQLNSALRDVQKVNKENLKSSEKLKKIAEDWLLHSVEFHKFFPVISMENINQVLKIMKEIKPRVFPVIGQIISAVANIIETGIKNGEFRKINTRIAAICFLNIMRAPLLLSLFTTEKIKSTEEILDLFFDGLKNRKELR
ncbi:MAG: TetR/AcrR family transcriptional regulator [candidate division WOR-3 bacterium]|nr:TetR/AcrR family transcriptional regulator [candidate division WOR-3 bacterium]